MRNIKIISNINFELKSFPFVDIYIRHDNSSTFLATKAIQLIAYYNKFQKFGSKLNNWIEMIKIGSNPDFKHDIPSFG